MKLILATSNKGKVREITKMCKDMEVIPYSDLIEEFEIVEDAPDFKGNALIKAHAVYKALNDENVIVLADDSGISVPALNNEPGIYSARYAGVDATDKDNLNKLLQSLKAIDVKRTDAFYTACMAIVSKEGESTVHGWMYGDVLDTTRGEGGFGYDPMFIPTGYDQTLGELNDETKSKLSHRSQALSRASCILKTLQKNRLK